MLFNSYLFIFLFLPLTLFIFFSAAKYSHRLALSVLFIASLIFYGWCDYEFVIILLFSITVNYIIGKNIIETAIIPIRKGLLWLGIIFNLGLLGYFKYIDFFIENINLALHAHLQLLNITLPIGISFFTFTQIAYLADSYKDQIKKYHFLNYALFVSYFPHLIAGPIIHHKEVMPQFEKNRTFRFNSRNVLLGLTLFAIGLFKKVVIADYLAYFVSPVFDAHLEHIATTDAWIGALSYTFELYFDFSGYSDMALGLSLLIGIRLPINFYSPYKATNIIDFWRRWNMTLSRFLRDYLYIPLGGNRKGVFRRYINLLVTMLLGGLWHGANGTFIFWGFLHGIYLSTNHGWIALKEYLGLNTNNHFIFSFLSGSVTFISVVVAWVFFRSPNFSIAQHILHSMFFEFSTQQQWGAHQKFAILITLAMAVTWLFPNSYQLLSRFKPALLEHPIEIRARKIIAWRPTLTWNFFVAVIFVLGIMFIQSSSVFLYFRF